MAACSGAIVTGIHGKRERVPVGSRYVPHPNRVLSIGGVVSTMGWSMGTDKDTEDFQRDGVAFLAGVFEREWIDLLRQGVEQNIANPSERGRLWDRDEQDRTSLYDSQVWREISPYRKFVRAPGSQFRTPWHPPIP